jgi:hypothetical protein
MSAPAVGPGFSTHAVALEIEVPGGFSAAGGSEMRDRLIVVRDTLIVLGIQIAFRMGLLLRRWNM